MLNKEFYFLLGHLIQSYPSVWLRALFWGPQNNLDQATYALGPRSSSP